MELLFDEAWERRVEGVIDAASGLTVYFISKADLIASKLTTGGTRDLADVEEIREAEASQPVQDQAKPPRGLKK